MRGKNTLNTVKYKKGYGCISMWYNNQVNHWIFLFIYFVFSWQNGTSTIAVPNRTPGRCSLQIYGTGYIPRQWCCLHNGLYDDFVSTAQHNYTKSHFHTKREVFLLITPIRNLVSSLKTGLCGCVVHLLYKKRSKCIHLLYVVRGHLSLSCASYCLLQK